MENLEGFPEGGHRVLRFLAGGPVSLYAATASGKMLLKHETRGVIAVERKLLDAMMSQGLLARSSHTAALSAEGARLAQRLLAARLERSASQRDLDTITVETEAGPSVVLANMAESPLGQLARRKGRDGQLFLAGREFDAGERLRTDYTRGQIMPRLGANWIASVSSGKRGSGGGMVDLTDAALAARQRVDRAIAAVGPELAGVLIDVCCFLKGLELVEMERGWPVRSAKIVLKTALAALARHYHPAEAGTQRRQALHWGAEDYRPSID